MEFVRVAVNVKAAAADKLYDYKLAQGQKVHIGARVCVPFGRSDKKTEAIVLAFSQTSQHENPKLVLQVLDDQPIISEKLIKLASWIKKRYFCTFYEAVKVILPPGLWFSFENGTKRKISDRFVKMVSIAAPENQVRAYIEDCRYEKQREVLEILLNSEFCSAKELQYMTGASQQTLSTLSKNGMVEFSQKEVYKRPDMSNLAVEEQQTELNDSQQQAYNGILEKINTGAPSCSLLFGVTGSGKTHVYIELIKQVLQKGKGAIVLVPEIALTPQLLQRFYSHFGESVAVLHSALTGAERFDEYKRVKNGMARVVIGTRLAVFAPVENLGIIILDEEQEHTYKSFNCPKYHARDIAKFRCVQHSAALVLGSATPSVESMYAAQTGKYSLFTLDTRYNQMALPRVTITDMKQAIRDGYSEILGPDILEQLTLNIKNGEQSILFINRRGSHKLIMCVDCGATFDCPNCSVHLTYHTANKRLVCHHCGYSAKVPDKCQCSGPLKFVGYGTQRVQAELAEKFPGVPVMRMDTDTTATTSHKQLLDKFEQEKIPILVGTQMIAKGLDFENVTLVGVLCPDQALFADDFRAGETTFSMITQVVGRAGRGALKGRAVIQTYSPKNYVIQTASKQDYQGFYQDEIRVRKISSLPPFFDFYTFYGVSMNEDACLKSMLRLRGMIDKLAQAYYKGLGIRVFGPTPANVLKVNKKFRYKIVVACKESTESRDFVDACLQMFRADKQNRSVSIFADINSYDLT